MTRSLLASQSIESTLANRMQVLLAFQHAPDSPLAAVHSHPTSLHLQTIADNQARAAVLNKEIEAGAATDARAQQLLQTQQGLRNAVATLGTATSEEHLKRLFRVVPSVLFCFDGDQAGRNAAWRALEATLPCLQDGRRARFLFLPEGEDPDTLVRAEGTDAFKARINQHAQPLADYFFQQLTEEADPRSLEGKAHMATLAAPLIDKVPGANLRILMRQRLTEITGLTHDMVSQLAQSAPVKPQAQSAYDPGIDYDAMPDYSDFQQPDMYIPQQEWTPKKPGAGGKKWENKPWDKKGKRGGERGQSGDSTGEATHPAREGARP